MSKHHKATKFNRIFDPEFLAARKDITPVQLAAAEGDLEAVAKHVIGDAKSGGKSHGDIFELKNQNRDGNTLLLLAVANNHPLLAKTLLEATQEASTSINYELAEAIGHKNSQGMDALDYATMESIRSPIAKVVLSFCSFVVPEPIDGPFFFEAEHSLHTLREEHVCLASTALIGKKPDLHDPFAKDTEYKIEWVKNLNYMVNQVRRGLLILSDDVGYLERDALLTGCLEVNMQKRMVFSVHANKKLPFTKALTTLYADVMESRMIRACTEGNSMAVVGLLKAKAHANIEDIEGQTCLMHAAHRGEPLVVRSLLSANARVNSVNKEGFSAFLLAAVGNSEDVVRLLLRAKADLHMKSYKGNGCLDFVKHEGHTNILQIIHQEHKSQEHDAMMAKVRGPASAGTRSSSVKGRTNPRRN